MARKTARRKVAKKKTPANDEKWLVIDHENDREVVVFDTKPSAVKYFNECVEGIVAKVDENHVEDVVCMTPSIPGCGLLLAKVESYANICAVIVECK